MKKLKRLLPIALIIALLTFCLVPAQPVCAGTVDESVGLGTDDVEKGTASHWVPTGVGSSSGYYSSVYYALESGLRFQTVAVPQGATITTAYLTFTAQVTGSLTVVNSTICGEDTDDAVTFSDLANYNARERTTASVPWNNIGAWTIESEYESPEIKTVIQEIVNRDGWTSGNDLVIFWGDPTNQSTNVDGTFRGQYCYEGGPTKTAQLHIEYTISPEVTTNAATLVEETTATLNANLTTLGDYTPVYAFFQYGLTTGYGTNTTEQSKTETGTYSQAIADLSPGTEYHFRAAVKYDTSYVYGSDETLDTKPLEVTNVRATTGTTSVTLNWDKGTGSDTTVIRRGSTDFPSTPTTGVSVYAGTGTEVVDSTLITNQTYYYSLWAKSAAAVYSDTYITITATPSADVLSAPDTLDIIDVKVFTDYLEKDDQLYVIRYKIIYDAGDPTQDCADFFNFELLDGTALKAQIPVESWGYKPGSIYQSTLSAPNWGEAYTVRLRGNDMAWGVPPETSWNLTSGDWIGADLEQLDAWVITTAEAIQAYEEIEMVIYAPSGTVLSSQGGIIFNMGIPGLSTKRPHLFSTSIDFPDPQREEHPREYEAEREAERETALGPYLWEKLEEGGDFLGMEPEEFGAWAFGGVYLLVALGIGVVAGSLGAGLGGGVPVLLGGMWFGLVPFPLVAVIASVCVLYLVYIIWFRPT